MTKELPPFTRPGSLQELIQQISLRPTMFVGSFNIELVAAYIEGYHQALVHVKPDSIEPLELRNFGRWLAEKLDFPRNWSWSAGLKHKFPDDEVALEQLVMLYSKFVADYDADSTA